MSTKRGKKLRVNEGRIAGKVNEGRLADKIQFKHQFNHVANILSRSALITPRYYAVPVSLSLSFA